MIEIQKNIEKVISYLNSNVEYALLRNFEGLPFKINSRDIDIIINPIDLKGVIQEIINIQESLGWKILIYKDNDTRLSSIISAKIINSELSLIQWDLFINSSAYGLQLMSSDELIRDRQFNGFLYHVSKENEFLDKYLYNRAVGSHYPLKYTSTKIMMQDNKLVKSWLFNFFGTSDLSIIDNLSHRQILKKIIVYNLKNNSYQTGRKIIEATLNYIQSYLKSEVAISIAFTGPDGSGKTTVINGVVDKMSTLFSRTTIYNHFRPSILPNLGEAANAVGVKKDVDKDYTNPHRSSPKSLISSLCRLAYYTLDYIIGYSSKIKNHMRFPSIIIFDRYYSDILTDSRRSSIYLSHSLLYFWGKIFIPKMRFNFLITANTDIILARKQELDEKGIESINRKMNYLAQKDNYYLIMNNGTAEECIKKILNILIDKQHKRNITRL